MDATFYQHLQKVDEEALIFHTSARIAVAYLNKTRSAQIDNVVFLKRWRTIVFKLQVVHYAACIDL